MRGRLLAAVLALICGVALPQAPVLAQDMTFFRIGSGGAGGTYFPIAGLIANAVSNPPGSRPCAEGGSCGVPGLVAIAQSSHASVANVADVQSGAIESGLASADIVHWAYNGRNRFADTGASDKLRIISSLFPEHLQLVLPRGTQLGSLGDLEGMRVGIAEAGSGTQVAVLELLRLAGISLDEIEPAELDNTQSAVRLADGQLDAYFYVAGTPTAAMVQLASTRGMELYSFSEQEVRRFLDAVPFYHASLIPAGTYDGIDYEVRTVAVSAQWVTSVDQPEDLVYGITQALWNANSRRLFDTGHAKATSIRPETALRAVTIPLHPGAERFYREAGLLN